jgi:hypothetical protein
VYVPLLGNKDSIEKLTCYEADGTKTKFFTIEAHSTRVFPTFREIFHLLRHNGKNPGPVNISSAITCNAQLCPHRDSAIAVQKHGSLQKNTMDPSRGIRSKKPRNSTNSTKFHFAVPRALGFRISRFVFQISDASSCIHDFHA